MKRYLSNRGCWMVLVPGHPKATGWGYVREHIIIAEEMLGRPLRDNEIVHHMGKQDDNSRIKVCRNRAEHNRFHRRLRAVRAGALPSWRKCAYCKQYDKPENLYIHGSRVRHVLCYNKYQQQIRGGH